MAWEKIIRKQLILMLVIRIHLIHKELRTIFWPFSGSFIAYIPYKSYSKSAYKSYLYFATNMPAIPNLGRSMSFFKEQDLFAPGRDEERDTNPFPLPYSFMSQAERGRTQDTLLCDKRAEVPRVSQPQILRLGRAPFRRVLAQDDKAVDIG